MKRALAAVGDTGAAPGSSTKASFQKRKEMRKGLEDFFPPFFYLIFHTSRDRRVVGDEEKEWVVWRPVCSSSIIRPSVSCSVPAFIEYSYNVSLPADKDRFPGYSGCFNPTLNISISLSKSLPKPKQHLTIQPCLLCSDEPKLETWLRFCGEHNQCVDYVSMQHIFWIYFIILIY